MERSCGYYVKISVICVSVCLVILLMRLLKAVKNIRLSLRQGDIPSMFFFAFGIDPLITYLHRRLSGILITSVPVFGPMLQEEHGHALPPLEV